MNLPPASAKPVTVIGGYLGAGKTTLVNHLLRNAAGRRIAVAVNEFGALPIDPDLIRSAQGDVLTLAGGCICCTFGDDLTSGLAALAAREDIDHVLIEASGVALPAAIASSLQLVAGLAHEATLVVADAETLREHAADKYLGDTITRQLAQADLVLLNKTDLVGGTARDDLCAWLADTAPRAKIVETRHAAITPDIALGAHEPRRFVADAPDPAHETGAIASLSLDLQKPLDVDRLADALADAALGLVRAKGFAKDRDGAWKTIQVVGRRAVVTPGEAREGAGRLVCIAHGRPLDRAAIEAAVASCGV